MHTRIWIHTVVMIAALLASIAATDACAQSFLKKPTVFRNKSANSTLKFSKDEEAMQDMTFEEILQYPETGKQSTKIAEYQNDVALVLKDAGYNVENMRNGEVIIVSIPCESLFNALDTVLLPDAGNILLPLFETIQQYGNYNIVVACHTDNTGGQAYKKSLTQSRSESVYAWAVANGADSTRIYLYAMSDTYPLTDNSSVANRKANRRLEFYFIPSREMIELARKNSLNIYHNKK